ncbi:50S ribosomal protein L11 methyltransferase [Companilactobacillus alimentarius]|uniref:Ribosomal protein L11 methyltransferase n=1 Tax=Companilactobacillus alimentarius DSM 20249 TaxID=1423720 RepID=A0A2K9HKD0_9LACO|nr:50S ribosomal protein L11 methyltransferase [Companilactobacillus alimentarius]AUI71285.1 ribosomal protein L11 methyltransferase [Companilactobacillus alimentarius DSM 20249]KRK75424.1 ribosomal protein L11 methyltransferase [Companilactobacillus alimentarius DSM 20249]MDT6951436.1 50S ribosomal protein L11 methyltransferase [Companilactobacillus alimentarius]GEO43792.1 ribosomal protein L11 methyltransferase [Companilactobacillus alimentarius]
MIWKKITVEIPNNFDPEIISDIFMRIGANGTEMVDDENKSVKTKINSYFDENNYSEEILNNLRKQIKALPQYGFDITGVEIDVSDLDDNNWQTEWEKYYHPVKISRYLTVVPNWVNYQPKYPDEHTIVMDPGKSFGTGTHPTTYSCMQALELILGDAKSLYDVGTGSGILSIQARQLGVRDIKAYDLDPVAVAAAKENIQLNPGCEDIEVYENSLLDGVSGKVDVIVANMLADVILKFIPQIDSHLNDNGFVVLSGIINEKEQLITEKMAEIGFIVLEVFHLKGWSTLICRRKEEFEAEDGAILR